MRSDGLRKNAKNVKYAKVCENMRKYAKNAIVFCPKGLCRKNFRYRGTRSGNPKSRVSSSVYIKHCPERNLTNIWSKNCFQVPLTGQVQEIVSAIVAVLDKCKKIRPQHNLILKFCMTRSPLTQRCLVSGCLIGRSPEKFENMRKIRENAKYAKKCEKIWTA